ncbi:hypothetical protein [Cohnella sp. GCM10027633]|uniref:hypothetical protein n=1 Tax=unclassified Cohnella TaxID=2636738 RepID=UPI0036445EC9
MAASTTSAISKKPEPGSQASAQAWINDSRSGQGGLEKYVAGQQAKYDAAVASGDNDMLNRLAADQQRVGYTLSAPKQEVQASSINTNTPQSYINQLNNARLDSTLAALGKSRDAALSNLNAEKGAIQPKFYDARNQVAAGAQQQARNFAEYMASRGGTSSGANAQAELSRNMSTQGNLGSLGRQEAQAFTDIARRTSDLNNAYESDVAGAKSGIEADRMSALLNQYNTDRQLQLQIDQLMGVRNGQKTLAGQQFDRSVLESDRNYDYQVGRDNITDAQQQWQNNFNQAQFDWNKAQTAWENSFKNRSFEQDMKDAAASRGLQWASLSQRDKEFVAEQAYREKQYQQDLGEAAGKRVSGAIDQLQGQYVSRDPSTGSITVTNPQALRSAVIAKGLADNETDEILIFFGLPTN